MPVGFGERRVDQEDVGDTVLLFGIDDLGLADEHTAIALERDQKRIRAIGDVVDEACRKSEEPAVIVDRVVEPAAAQQVAAGKYQIADRAVGEFERPPGVELPAHRVDTLTHLRPARDGDAFERLQRLFARAGVRKPRIEHLDNAFGTRPSFARDARGVLPKIRRPKAVAEKAPHLSCRRAIIVAVDGDGERHIGMADELAR